MTLTTKYILDTIRGIADINRKIATDMPDDCCAECLATAFEELLDALTDTGNDDGRLPPTDL